LDDDYDDDTSTILDVDDMEVIDITDQKKKGKPKDKVWEHFKPIDIPNSSHKGAQCSFCSQTWKRGKPNDMKAHLALRCPMVMHKIKLEYLRTVSSATSEDTSGESIQNQNDRNNKNNVVDIARSDRALVRFFVCCGIPFSVVDSPFFRDFVKSLCYKYEPPRRTALSTNYLDAETAKITLKMEEELRLLKNLTLGENFILYN
jgi:hypothetical protein